MSILEPEAAIWYSICWIIVITRIISRRLHLGTWKSFELDDYLILVAMAANTVVTAMMHVVINTSSNLIAPGEDVSKFSQEEIDHRVLGSKYVLVVEQMQLLTIWLVKACLLLWYHRMTGLLPQHKIVIGVAIYVAVGFVVMEVLYLGVWCRPFSQYWAVPPNSTQCSAATNHLITNAVLNITSDLMIISIPMPLLFRVKLPAKNKLVLMVIFLIGTFTIVAAALNKYYSFTNPFGVEWTIWYLREAYTAILCANLPLTYPLIQRIFKLRNWNTGDYSANKYGARSTHGTFSGFKGKNGNRRLRSTSGTFRPTVRRTESEEEINKATGGGLRIYQNTEFTVHTTSATEMGDIESGNNAMGVGTELKSARSGSSGEGKSPPRSQHPF